MHYFRTVLGRGMVGIIAPILKLSKAKAVDLMICRKVNDSPEIMQVANGKDFLGAAMRNKAFLLCLFALLPLVAFFIRGKLLTSSVSAREKLCFPADLFKFIHSTNLSACYVLGTELYSGALFTAGI